MATPLEMQLQSTQRLLELERQKTQALEAEVAALQAALKSATDELKETRSKTSVDALADSILACDVRGATKSDAPASGGKSMAMMQIEQQQAQQKAWQQQ